MKKYILSNSLNLIKRYYPQYDELKLAEIKYGLEGLYLSISKLIVIFIFSLTLGIFKETILLLVFFNILRVTGFGLHASKSWICLLTSSLIFIGGPLLATNITFPFLVKLISCLMAIILIYLYAPSDTKKHPLIHKKKRNVYKFITSINCIILVIILLIINNNVISNLILIGIITEVILVLPITYNLFNLPYNNYKNYRR